MASKMQANLKKVVDNLWEDSIEMMNGIIQEGENQAKKNAPWTDRTSAARNSLTGYTVTSPDVIIGILGIGVFYGKFLELSNGGKYRIIRPTLFAVENYLMSKLKKMGMRQ